MGSREILTLQLGTSANFVGAHFWNFQDELLGNSAESEWSPFVNTVDFHALYYTKEERNDVKYIPRVLMVDVSGSLGGVKYTAQEGPVGPHARTWDGPCDVHQASEVAQSTFRQELEKERDLDADDEAAADAHQASLEEAARQLSDGTVKYWTDFCKADFHARSIYTVPKMLMAPSGFSGWGDGSEVFSRHEVREGMEDSIRFFAETCDTLQAFVVTVDGTGGWAGFASRVLGEVAVDYPRNPVLLFSVQQPEELAAAGNETPDSMTHKIRSSLNEALCLSELAELTSIYTPLSTAACTRMPHLRVPSSSIYSASAVLAASIDNITLPFRLLPGSKTPLGEPVGAIDVRSFLDLIHSSRRSSASSLVAAALALPASALPADPARTAIEHDSRVPHGRNSAADSSMTNEAFQMGEFQCLTPGVSGGEEEMLSESIVLRGARSSAGPASTSHALSCLDTALLASRHLPRLQHRTVSPCPLLLPISFPPVFPAYVSKHGDMGSLPSDKSSLARKGGVDVASVPMGTRLAGSRGFERVLTEASKGLSSAYSSGHGKALLGSWGYEAHDVQEMRERLSAAARGFTSDDDDM